jgi:hypothetical protein
MFKRFSFMAIVLFSILNAENVVSDDSFSCQISKELETTIWSVAPQDTETCGNFTKASIEILAEQEGEDFDDLLVKTIKELVQEIDPERAASIYLISLKNTFDKVVNATNFESIVASKSEDELNQNFGDFLKKLIESVSSKDANLEQSICFATFSDETVKKITNSTAICMQCYFAKLNALTSNGSNSNDDMQTKIDHIKQLLIDLPKNILSSTVSVFEETGYAIDIQGLGL